MKTIWLSLILLCTLAACKQNNKTDQPNKETSFDLLTLPSEWVQLTKTDTGMIIFNSCDGGNLLITLSKVNDTVGLLMHGTQEDYDFVILHSGLIEKDTVLVKTKWRGWDELQDFKFVWVDKSKQVGKWMTTYKGGNKMEYTCVTADRQKDFKTVNQPCRECWGDECDEIEKMKQKKDAIKEVKDTVEVKIGYPSDTVHQ